MISKNRLSLFIGLLLSLMTLVSLYSFITIQTGSSPIPPRSGAAALESFIVIIGLSAASVLVFARSRYAAVALAILATHRFAQVPMEVSRGVGTAELVIDFVLLVLFAVGAIFFYLTINRRRRSDA